MRTAGPASKLQPLPHGPFRRGKSILQGVSNEAKGKEKPLDVFMQLEPPLVCIIACIFDHQTGGAQSQLGATSLPIDYYLANCPPMQRRSTSTSAGHDLRIALHDEEHTGGTCILSQMAACTFMCIQTTFSFCFSMTNGCSTGAVEFRIS